MRYITLAETIDLHRQIIECSGGAYKRIGHAAMEVSLVMNGVEIKASVDE